MADHIKAAEVALNVLRGQTGPDSQNKAKALLDQALDALLAEYEGKPKKAGR